MPLSGGIENEVDRYAMSSGVVARNWLWGVSLLVLAAGVIGVSVTQTQYKHGTVNGISAVVSANLPNVGPAFGQYSIDIVTGTFLMAWGALLLVLNNWSPSFLAHNAFNGNQWFILLFDFAYRLFLGYVLCQSFGITDVFSLIWGMGIFAAMAFFPFLLDQIMVDTIQGLWVYNEQALETARSQELSVLEDHDEQVKQIADAKGAVYHHRGPHAYVFQGFALVFAWVPIFAYAVSTIIVQANAESAAACPAREGISISLFCLTAFADILTYILTGVRMLNVGAWLRGIGNWTPLRFGTMGVVLVVIMLLQVGLGYELFVRCP